MCLMHCVARAEVAGYAYAEKNDVDLVPVSYPYQHAQTESCVPLVDTASPCSMPTVAPNGSVPITNLMEELLVMIFDDVINSEASSCQCRRKRAGWWLSSPRNLASVSRMWHAVVFTCPSLWRHVHLTPVQSVDALREHLRLSSPLPIQLTVHQWPFRSPTPASGAFSIVVLTAQLRSVLLPMEKDGTKLAPASQRVTSITINATESSTFLNFVLQTWTGPGSKFPALRHISMNGNLLAVWSRMCFFDGRNAPSLERLELNNVAIAQNMPRLPWGIGQTLTTLVWTAPMHRHGSLAVSLSCFYHVISSLPNLTTLELHEHVIALEFVSVEGMEDNGITPLTHVHDLRITGRAFLNAISAYMLFHLFPSLRHLAVRGRACSGPLGIRTVTLALQALVCLPGMFGWPTVLPALEDLELECVDGGLCEEWKTWCVGELELWRQWRETTANAVGREPNVARVRMHMEMGEDLSDTDEDEDLEE